jgi:transcriptional regulator with XRE-family HTH domain
MKRTFRLETVGDLIREQRIARKLSQQAVAEQACIDQSKLSRIEAGRTHQPDPQVLGCIADVLGVNVGLYYAAAGYPIPYRHIFADPADFFRRQYGIEATPANLDAIWQRVAVDFARYLKGLSLLTQEGIDWETTHGLSDVAPWPLASLGEMVLYHWFGLLHSLGLSTTAAPSPNSESHHFTERLAYRPGSANRHDSGLGRAA